MNLTASAARGIIKRAADTCGVKLPKPVAIAESRAETVATNVRTLRNQDADLAAAVADALAEDRDPTADPAVQRLVTARVIASNGIPTMVENAATADLVDVYRQHADAILKAFQPAYTDAAKQLEAAHSVLGDVELDQTAAILDAGAAAAEAWAVARRALVVVETAGQAFTTLMSFTHLGNPGAYSSALRHADITWSEWGQHQLGTAQKVKPWDLVRAGIPLSLPTATEYAERLKTLDEGQRLAQIAAEERNTAALMNRVGA